LAARDDDWLDRVDGQSVDQRGENHAGEKGEPPTEIIASSPQSATDDAADASDATVEQGHQQRGRPDQGGHRRRLRRG
jgi:hypothetical protein